MRNTNNSKEVQGTGTAQELQEQFNIATQDLFLTFDLDFIKESWELTMIAWIGSDNCTDCDCNERSNIFHFNFELIKYFETTAPFVEKSKKEPIDFSIFKPFIDARDYKTSKKYLNEVFTSFLISDEADDKPTRQDAINLNKEINRYLKKIYYLSDLFNSKNLA